MSMCIMRAHKVSKEYKHHNIPCKAAEKDWSIENISWESQSIINKSSNRRVYYGKVAGLRSIGNQRQKEQTLNPDTDLPYSLHKNPHHNGILTTHLHRLYTGAIYPLLSSHSLAEPSFAHTDINIKCSQKVTAFI